MTHVKGKAFGDDGGDVEAWKVLKEDEGATPPPLWVGHVVYNERGAAAQTESGSFEVPYGFYLAKYRHGVEALSETQMKVRFKSFDEDKGVNQDELREKRGNVPALSHFDQVNGYQPQAVQGTRTANDMLRRVHEQAIQDEAEQARKDMHAKNVGVEDAGSRAAADRGQGEESDEDKGKNDRTQKVDAARRAEAEQARNKAGKPVGQTGATVP